MIDLDDGTMLKARVECVDKVGLIKDGITVFSFRVLPDGLEARVEGFFVADDLPDITVRTASADAFKVGIQYRFGFVRPEVP